MTPRRFFMIAGPTTLALFLVPALVVGVVRWACVLSGVSDIDAAPAVAFIATVNAFFAAAGVAMYAFEETEGE